MDNFWVDEEFFEILRTTENARLFVGSEWQLHFVLEGSAFSIPIAWDQIQRLLNVKLVWYEDAVKLQIEAVRDYIKYRLSIKN